MGYLMIVAAILVFALGLLCLSRATREEPMSVKRRALLGLAFLLSAAIAGGLVWNAVTKIPSAVLHLNAVTETAPK